MNNQDKRGSFFYTLLGYLMILVFLLAVALLIGAILYRFVTVPGRNLSVDAFAKWGGLAIFTTGTFWFVVQKSRTRWRSRMFWMVLGAIFAVHINIVPREFSLYGALARLVLPGDFDHRGTFYHYVSGLDLREVREEASLERRGRASVTRRLT